MIEAWSNEVTLFLFYVIGDDFVCELQVLSRWLQSAAKRGGGSFGTRAGMAVHDRRAASSSQHSTNLEQKQLGQGFAHTTLAARLLDHGAPPGTSPDEAPHGPRDAPSVEGPVPRRQRREARCQRGGVLPRRHSALTQRGDHWVENKHAAQHKRTTAGRWLTSSPPWSKERMTRRSARERSTSSFLHSKVTTGTSSWQRGTASKRGCGRR